MKLLITGGAGFIGSAGIRHLITNTNDEVVNIAKLTYAGNLESLAEVSDCNRYSFEQVDICSRTEVDRVLAQHQPDAIMHLAAESHVDRSIDGPADFIETNIVGTYTLLEATRQYWQALEADKKANFPGETFETGIFKTVQWYLDNLNWCQRVQNGSSQRQRLGITN